MRALSSVKWLRSLRAAGTAGILFLAACYGGNNAVNPSGLAAGKAQVKIELVPTGTDCIVITVVGPTPPGTKVTDQFDVSPQSSSTFSLVNLPIGSDTFSASSYSVACAQTAGATATYSSDSQTAVIGGAPVSVELDMGDGMGDATVGVNFPALSGSITEYNIPSGQDAPEGITTGPDGNVWFTEWTGSNIGKITPGGSISEFPATAADSGTSDIAAGPDGNLWFTEQGIESVAATVGRITPSGAVSVFTTPSSGSTPSNIVAGPDGNLWFTETDINKIGKITPAGVATEFSITTPGSAPQGIAAGSDGNLWFTETIGNKIGRITPGGTITEFAVAATNPGPGQTILSAAPAGITAGPDGNLWFTETGYNVIGCITTSGVVTLFVAPTQNSDPQNITAGPDGNIWFTETMGNNIGRITPTGTITEFPIPTVASKPYGITAGPDGNIWFTESAANKIGMLAIF